jgi:hypothetical protein
LLVDPPHLTPSPSISIKNTIKPKMHREISGFSYMHLHLLIASIPTNYVPLHKLKITAKKKYREKNSFG